MLDILLHTHRHCYWTRKLNAQKHPTTDSTRPVRARAFRSTSQRYKSERAQNCVLISLVVTVQARARARSSVRHVHFALTFSLCSCFVFALFCSFIVDSVRCVRAERIAMAANWRPSVCLHKTKLVRARSFVAALLPRMRTKAKSISTCEVN